MGGLLGQFGGGRDQEGAWRPKSLAPILCPFLAESTLSSNRPPWKKRVPSPILWPAGVCYHEPPPPPQPSLLSLVTSGIQMWKPNRFILKGDLLQGREVAGICVSQWVGRGSE